MLIVLDIAVLPYSGITLLPPLPTIMLPNVSGHTVPKLTVLLVVVEVDVVKTLPTMEELLLLITVSSLTMKNHGGLVVQPKLMIRLDVVLLERCVVISPKSYGKEPLKLDVHEFNVMVEVFLETGILPSAITPLLETTSDKSQ